MVRLVVDTDPGVDDAHALMMAAAHPDTRIVAVTTVAGNVPLSRTTVNALTILDHIRIDAPVYAGAARAIVQRVEDASDVHGSDGLGDSGFQPSARQVEPEHAANALVRLGRESDGDLTLVALGPLTNVALATMLDPELPGRYARLVVMGGAIRAMGNTRNPSAEFNAWSDPEAAAIVLGAWPNATLVSWETTLAHPFDADQVARLLAHDGPRGEFFRRITAQTLAFVREYFGRDTMVAPDPLAMAVALDPAIVSSSERHPIRVELAGEHTRGQTTVEWSGRHGSAGGPEVEIVLEVRPDRFFELFEAAVRG